MWEQKLRKKIKGNSGDSPPPFGAEKVAAAMLLILPGSQDHDCEILLTKRTLSVQTHRGQISLPGGFPEKADQSWEETALRETYEEIGLPKEQVEFLGYFRSVQTKRGVSIVVYLGILPERVDLKPNPDEVAKILYLPGEVLVQLGLSRMMVEDSGVSISSIGLEWQGEVIWGATARVLETLYKILKEPA